MATSKGFMNPLEFQEQFEQEQEEQPGMGDSLLFEKMVEGTDTSREEIEQYWNIVEPEGYYKSEKAEILDDMYRKSKGY